ncbi:hypothetical protein V8G54_019869 [Vigna mungo]|uniref:Uncharacterized protein n=1 Tax=Vigna mungo TaxID=3915 RepID=A0AAQ3NDA9_VIGMU
MVVTLYFYFFISNVSLWHKGIQSKLGVNIIHAMQLPKMSDPSHKWIISKQRLAIKLLCYYNLAFYIKCFPEKYFRLYYTEMNVGKMNIIYPNQQKQQVDSHRIDVI